MLAQVLVVPVIQLAVLSNAATFEIGEHADLVVVDEDRSATSRGLVDRLRRRGSLPARGGDALAERADEAMLRRDGRR